MSLIVRNPVTRTPEILASFDELDELAEQRDKIARKIGREVMNKGGYTYDRIIFLAATTGQTEVQGMEYGQMANLIRQTTLLEDAEVGIPIFVNQAAGNYAMGNLAHFEEDSGISTPISFIFEHSNDCQDTWGVDILLKNAKTREQYIGHDYGVVKTNDRYVAHQMSLPIRIASITAHFSGQDSHQSVDRYREVFVGTKQISKAVSKIGASAVEFAISGLDP